MWQRYVTYKLYGNMLISVATPSWVVCSTHPQGVIDKTIITVDIVYVYINTDSIANSCVAIE